MCAPYFLRKGLQAGRQAAISAGTWCSEDRTNYLGLYGSQIRTFITFDSLFACGCVHLCSGIHGGQRCQISLELNLIGACKPSDGVLGTRLGFSE